jgi:hypothetical protein
MPRYPYPYQGLGGVGGAYPALGGVVGAYAMGLGSGVR